MKPMPGTPDDPRPLPSDGNPAREPAPLAIRRADLRGPLAGTPIEALLREHLAFVAVHSPPESIHALDLEGLRASDVTFWGAWRGDELVGCGALREIDPRHGEIKSMRTAAARRRLGVGRAMLRHLLDVARERGYRRVSLETGAQEGFAPARALYAGHGFTVCGPFDGYVADPASVFMTLRLVGDEAGA